MYVGTWVGQVTWSITAERNARRVREAYLTAVLRANIAYHDMSPASSLSFSH